MLAAIRGALSFVLSLPAVRTSGLNLVLDVGAVVVADDGGEIVFVLEGPGQREAALGQLADGITHSCCLTWPTEVYHKLFAQPSARAHESARLVLPIPARQLRNHKLLQYVISVSA